MEEIMDIIIKLAGSLVGVCLVYLVGVASNYLKAKLNAREQAALEDFVTALVKSAEQMLKEEDPDGSIRLDYVQTLLIEAGYDLTDAVRAVIESKVYEINSEGAGK